MSKLYRSPLTRWFLAAVAVTAGLVFTFGSEAKWRSTTSLHWLAQAPIPLQAWGVALIVYGLLLLPGHTRPAGYAAGAVIWGVFTISITATIGESGPKNIVVVGAMFQIVAFHAYSVRSAWAQRFAP